MKKFMPTQDVETCDKCHGKGHIKKEKATDIVILYRAWKDAPHCSCQSHFDKTGKHKADKNVCEKERLWRSYVRMRDDDPTKMRSDYQRQKIKGEKNESTNVYNFTGGDGVFPGGE